MTDQTEPQGPEQLRAALERAKQAATTAAEENALLKTQLKARTFKDLGVDTDTKIGKLAAEAYEGELTADAVGAYLRELEFPGVKPAASGEVKPEIQAAIAAQKAADKVVGGGADIDPTSEAVRNHDALESKMLAGEALSQNDLAAWMQDEFALRGEAVLQQAQAVNAGKGQPTRPGDYGQE